MAQVERIELFDPKTDAVFLMIKKPAWVDVLSHESGLIQTLYNTNTGGQLPRIVRIPVSKEDFNSHQLKILTAIFNKRPLTLATNEYELPTEGNRGEPLYFLNSIPATRTDMHRAFRWFQLPDAIIEEFLDSYIPSVKTVPNTEEIINRTLRNRRRLLNEYEPGINGKTIEQRRYNQKMENLERRRNEIYNRLRKVSRRQPTRRRGRYNSNSEYDEENYLNSKLQELYNNAPNPPQSLENAYAELSLPSETMDMSNIEFERWLRTNPQTKALRNEQHPKGNNYRLNTFFNKNGGRRRTRRSKRTRRRATR